MIDFHCHLDLYDDPAVVLREIDAMGIYVLSVTNAPAAWEKTAHLAEGHSRVRTAVGIHPALAHTQHANMDLFRSLLPRTRYVGEVGLDGSPNLAPYQRSQRAVFEHVLEACDKAGGRIVSVHSRRAVSQVLASLRAWPNVGVVVLHWFSGNERELVAACELGCWFSVGPSMVTSGRGLALLAEMPMERVLPESDGPFVRVDDRPARPSDTALVISAMQTVWQATEAEVLRRCRENLADLANRIASP